MVNWIRFEQGSSVWDAFLAEALDCNIFQSYAWGEYKKHFGWTPLRFIATNKKQVVVGMAQILVKEFPLGFGIGWAPGGPIYRFAGLNSIGLGNNISILIKYLHDLFPRVLVRFHGHEIHDSYSSFEFRTALKRPFIKINSGYTVRVDLNKFGDNKPELMSAKHRYYWKKATSHQIDWIFGINEKNISSLVEVHSDMVFSKSMQSIAIDKKDVTLLCEIFRESHLTLLTGYMADKPVTSCLTYDFGRRSIYMLAATNQIGRQVSAAYAMIPILFLHLKNKGVEDFDFGGIDPGNINAEGVDRFKKGFGGTIVEYVGEWESASSELIRCILNFGLIKIGRRS